MFSRSFPHQFHPQPQERESPSDDVSKGGDDDVEGGGGDAAAAAAAGKRPRGRPPGSKNKPKRSAADAAEPSPSAALAPEPVMRPHVLEIRPGHDVADALARYARRRGIGICVLSAAGAVSDVTLRRGGAGPPAAAAAEGGAAVRLLGRLEILSMSGALLLPGSPSASASALAVSLSGPQGQVLGGTVAGSVVAAETVVVVAAAFSNPAVHRVPAEDDDDDDAAAADADAEATAPEEDHPHPHPHPHHHHQHHRRRQQRRGPAPPLAPAPATSPAGAGESVYGAHFPSDVAWAPTARRPPPPPPPHY